MPMFSNIFHKCSTKAPEQVEVTHDKVLWATGKLDFAPFLPIDHHILTRLLKYLIAALENIDSRTKATQNDATIINADKHIIAVCNNVGEAAFFKNLRKSGQPNCKHCKSVNSQDIDIILHDSDS